jgi:hypothetical protein
MREDDDADRALDGAITISALWGIGAAAARAGQTVSFRCDASRLSRRCMRKFDCAGAEYVYRNRAFHNRRHHRRLRHRALD